MTVDGLRNLGPASARLLASAGVNTVEDLEQLGAAEAYMRVREATGHENLNLLWALEGALLDVDWRLLPPVRRRDLLVAVGRDENPDAAMTPL